MSAVKSGCLGHEQEHPVDDAVLAADRRRVEQAHERHDKHEPHRRSRLVLEQAGTLVVFDPAEHPDRVVAPAERDHEPEGEVHARPQRP